MVAGPARKMLPLWAQPRTREECSEVPRPCPYESCRHHLEVDHDRARRIRASGLGRPTDLPAAVRRHDYGQSCSLDLADEGARTLEEVGEVMGISREAVRLIEERALSKLAKVIG